MTSARITKSNVGKIEEKIEAEMRKRLALVGEVVASQVRENISTSTRAAGPSAPGEMPHADEGTLRKSTTYDVSNDELAVDVGTTVEYAPHLEHGTKKMDARPFLEATANQVENEVQAILTEKIE